MRCNHINLQTGKQCVRLIGHEGPCRCVYAGPEGITQMQWHPEQQVRPVNITYMLRTCPRCKGRVFKEAYWAGMYFISCCACGEFAVCKHADEAVSAFCSDEVAA